MCEKVARHNRPIYNKSLGIFAEFSHTLRTRVMSEKRYPAAYTAITSMYGIFEFAIQHRALLPWSFVLLVRGSSGLPQLLIPSADSGQEILEGGDNFYKSSTLSSRVFNMTLH